MTEETRGRKKKYSRELLREITSKYIEQQHIGTVTASKLAIFAKGLGYEDIKYYHFTRNAEDLQDIIQLDNAAGRGKKYTVSDLRMIIEKCCEVAVDYEKLNVATLVKYANKLGYTDINAYHFTKEPEIKELIEALGRDSSFLLNSNEKENFMIQHANILKADDVVDAFRTKPLKLKLILRDFSKKYEALKLDYLNISMQFGKVKEEVAKLQQLEQDYKKLKDERDYYKKEYERISQYDALNDKLFMLQRLNETGIKVNLSEATFQSLLEVNERTNDNIEDDEVGNWLGDYSETKDCSNSIEGNAVPFKKVENEKIKKVDDFLNRFSKK